MPWPDRARQGNVDDVNKGSGIELFNASHNVVGGKLAGSGNLISGNQAQGILLISAHSTEPEASARLSRFLSGFPIEDLGEIATDGSTTGTEITGNLIGRRVLRHGQAPVPGLHMAELALDHPERMLDLYGEGPVANFAGEPPTRIRVGEFSLKG